MKLLGLDPALTNTGWAKGDDRRRVDLGTIQGRGTGPARMAQVRDEIVSIAADVDLVIIEGFAYGKHSAAYEMGGIGWMIRTALWEARIPYAVVAPNTLKVYATGKGRGVSKNLMVAEAVRRLNFPGSSDNEADALWLLALGLDAKGFPLVAMPQAHRRAIASVRWPGDPFLDEEKGAAS